MMRTVLILVCILPSSAWAQDVEPLAAGAARVDITPPEGSKVRMSGYGGRKEPFKGVHDRLYYRAIVLERGDQRAAIVVGDVSAIPTSFWEKTAKKIEEAAGIPRDNILLCATHTHAGPSGP